MLESLEGDEEAESSLAGLREILSQRGGAVLNFVVPYLIESPIEPSRARALASLCEVAGAALHHHLDEIVPSLIEEIFDEDGEIEQHIADAGKAVMVAVQADGLEDLLPMLLQGIQGNGDDRRAYATLLGYCCANNTADLEDHETALIQHLMPLLAEEDADLMKAGWTALMATTKRVPKERMAPHIPVLRMELKALIAARRYCEDRLVPGFCQPKGIDVIYPLLQEGLLTGSPDTVREQAALGIGELIETTSPAHLKPFVPKITGPLIRIIGDRFPWQVKAAILSTLTLLIYKSGIVMKPFMPQLQTTFVKNLSDPTPTVRGRAIAALEALMTLDIKRMEPLVTELHNGVRANEGGIRDTMLQALCSVLAKGGDTLKPELIMALGSTMVELFDDRGAGVRLSACKVFGVYSRFATEEDLWNVLDMAILQPGPSEEARQGQMAALKGIAENSNGRPAVDDKREEIIEHISSYMQSTEKLDVQSMAISAAASFVMMGDEEDVTVRRLLQLLVDVMQSGPNESRTAAAEQLKRCCRTSRVHIDKNLDLLLPVMLKVVESKTYAIKHASQRALVHILAVHTNPQVVQNYTGPEAAAVKDQAATLVKLGADSEAED